MMDINHVVLVGRLTRDAEFKVLPSGQTVCNFSIAINRRKKVGDQWEDEANYFDIVLWGKQADSLNRYLVKGKQIGIDGELRQDRWQQDGQNRSKVVVSANNIQLLGGGAGGGGNGSYGGASGNGAAYGGGGGGSYGGGSSFGEGGGSSQNEQSGASDRGITDDIPF
jgi:single-strand DNA-binding protein